MRKAITTLVLAVAICAGANAADRQKRTYTNEPKVGMTEQEVRDCINPDDYTVTERKTKGPDIILDVNTRSYGGGMGDGFHVVDGSKPQSYRVVYISKISGKVNRVVKRKTNG